MRTLNLISCIDDNGYIGNGDNDLLYYNKDDMHRFKTLTKGSIVVMGMNTYKSIGEKPLPNRMNIVITSQVKNVAENEAIRFVDSVASAIGLMREFIDKDVFVIGGGQIYSQFLKTMVFDNIYLTRVSNWGLNSFLEIDTGNFMGVRFPMYELKENVARCKEDGIVVKYSAYPENGTLSDAVYTYKFYRIRFQKNGQKPLKLENDYTWWPKENEL